MQRAVNTLVSHVVNNGIRHVVICPGSRNAPLILAFSRHPGIQCYSLIDERSAAFTSLGMAVALGSPIAIICTSGTAVLNLYPAIAEAYYSQIPLLVITADRPSEWIDQWDGQCIRQTDIFTQHILGSFTYNPLNPNINLNEAIGLCSFPKKGPVHINVPMAEPLYEAKNEEFIYDELPPVPKHFSFAPNHIPGDLEHTKIILLAGADVWGDRLSQKLEALVKEGKIVVLADVVSGLHASQTVTNWDAICTVADDELKQKLQPGLLITIGKFTVSKGLKKFIRQYKPLEHWHVTGNHTIANPFETNPTELESDEEIFLEWLVKAADHIDNSYNKDWLQVSEKMNSAMESLFKDPAFNEFTATKKILEALPQQSYLHVGNSMPIRFVSFLAGKLKDVNVYGNRGTSGIDGSTSTAAGTSMMMDNIVFLLTGDLSFFYDINGLWNRYLKPNFKIIVLNNGGGGIFRLIDGPHDLPEREDYFSTKSNRNCRLLTDEFGFEYYKANDFVSLQTEFETFCKDNTRPAILEIFAEPKDTIEFYKQFKKLKINN